MQIVETPDADDLIIYFKKTYAGGASPNHVGVMISKTMVRSHWGFGWKEDHVLDHEIDNVPMNYGPYVRYYRLKPEYK